MPKRKANGSSAPMANPVVTFGPTATHAWLSLANECARFTAERMQQNRDAQRAMFACKTPMDVVAQQFNYCQSVSQLYSKQTTRFLEIATGTARRTAQEAAQGHSRKYDDIPL